MIYSLEGRIGFVGINFFVLETSGIGFKVFSINRLINSLAVGKRVKVFTYANIKEDALDIYGFRNVYDLSLFSVLLTVGGVGPRIAIGIMNVAETKDILSAIKEGRADILSKAGGVGSKLAQRIVLELKDKVVAEDSSGSVARLDSDDDLIEMLVGLGFRKDAAKSALDKVGRGGDLEDRFKGALNILAKR